MWINFEIWYPFGISCKKHKMCVYWNLSNYSLSFIYLAVLCRSEDVRSYGYEKVLEPLLQDLVTLENQDIFVVKLGDFVKGTIHCVIADNLGAHGIAGFIKSFAGEFICWFCVAQKSEIQQRHVSSGTFTLRCKEMHKMLHDILEKLAEEIFQ